MFAGVRQRSVERLSAVDPATRPSGARRGRDRLRVVRRPRLVIAELDARGEIDSHTALCLRCAIEDLLAHGASEIVIDLRDLTAIDRPALALLHQARRTAAAAGVPLSLLIDERSAGGDLVRVVGRSGLPVQPARPG